MPSPYTNERGELIALPPGATVVQPKSVVFLPDPHALIVQGHYLFNEQNEGRILDIQVSVNNNGQRWWHLRNWAGPAAEQLRFIRHWYQAFHNYRLDGTDFYLYRLVDWTDAVVKPVEPFTGMSFFHPYVFA